MEIIQIYLKLRLASWLNEKENENDSTSCCEKTVLLGYVTSTDRYLRFVITTLTIPSLMKRII